MSAAVGCTDDQVFREGASGLTYRDVGEAAFMLTKRSPEKDNSRVCRISSTVWIPRPALSGTTSESIVPADLTYGLASLTPDKAQLPSGIRCGAGTFCKAFRRFRMLFPWSAACHQRWDGKGYPDGLLGEKYSAGGTYRGGGGCLDAMILFIKI